MKGMKDLRYPATSDTKFDLHDKFEQRVFLETVRGFEIVLSVGDNLADYADYYGGRQRADHKKRHDTWADRKYNAEQDHGLWGTEFILIPNAVYGGWLRAIYENGAGDESERAPPQGAPVRGVPSEEQRTRLDQLLHDLPEDEMRKLVPDMG
jgi:predicted secreted acid phosphatase